MRAMKTSGVILALLFAVASSPIACSQENESAPAKSYLGFDRNVYPGDDSLPILRKSFFFTSYWLSPPPGEKQSTWLGKRAVLEAEGFGFVVLVNGKNTREIKTSQNAHRFASTQSQDAAKLAAHEGFPRGTIIFLDVEEGGRLLPLYHRYLQAWADNLSHTGYRPGVYCSGVAVDEGGGAHITTADDIRVHMGSRPMAYWVYNDACPPSPGGTLPAMPPQPANSGISYATVWQYVRSPQEKEISARCTGYASDGNYYAPGDSAHTWFLDVNVATSSNPSAAKK
jgi:Domain of unknown function (DUF1906)